MLYFSRLLEIIGLISIIIFVSTLYLINQITDERHNVLENNYDAIIILSGNFDRASRASKLYFEKKAKYIYLSRENALIHNYSDPLKSKKTYEIYLNIINKNGIDRKNIIIYGTDNKSTIDEARELKKLEFKNNASVLIVTDIYHIYRANKIFEDMDFEFTFDFHYHKLTDNWFENKKSIMIVLSEVIKSYLYIIFEDFDAYLDYI